MSFCIRNLNWKMKCVLVGVLFWVFFAETMALVHYSVRIGHGNESTYFRGSDEESNEETMIAYPKSLREIVEVAHPHSYGFLFLFALLGLIWCGVRISRRVWLAWLICFFSCLAGLLGMPFIIRFGGSWAAGGFSILGACLTVLLYQFIGTVTWEMTRPSDSLNP